MLDKLTNLLSYMSPVFPIFHIVPTMNSCSQTCLNSFRETHMELGLGLEGDLMQSYLEQEILYEV